ncbi:MAG TPA: hypothetical protein DEP05_07390 [Betaproteobacteria bacterium]|nr:hypothetical protein [Betaproteobacteria bacterium]
MLMTTSAPSPRCGGAITQWLFLLLLIANLFFWGYQTFGRSPLVKPLNDHTPLNRHKIQLLTAAQAQRLTPVATPPVCLEWGSFSENQAQQALQRLNQLHLGNRLSWRKHNARRAYWVYIPPQSTRQAAILKLKQVRAFGITDGFIVQDGASWQNAISLGVFKTQAAADNYERQLKSKGVHSATVGPHEPAAAKTVFQIRGADDATMKQLVQLKLDFPGSTVKAVDCAALPHPAATPAVTATGP